MGLIVKYSTITETLKRFVGSIGTVLNTTRTVFSDFVSLKKFELQFDARTIYLSKYLNTQFDAISERIYIINDSTLIDVFIFLISETITALEETYIFRTAEVITADEETYLDKEIGIPGTSFQVVLPSALSVLQADPNFIASIEKYNLADKVFSVIVV